MYEFHLQNLWTCLSRDLVASNNGEPSPYAKHGHAPQSKYSSTGKYDRHITPHIPAVVVVRTKKAKRMTIVMFLKKSSLITN